MFAYDDLAHLDETSDLISNENKKIMKDEWGKYWDYSKEFLCEKSPPNLVRTRFLQEMFSDHEVYFITMMRHPVPTSIATQKRS